jgi:N6-L-threonylcarbamoyladenine synthase
MDTKDKVKKEILILSIDTSCDETSASVTRNLNVLSNVISSQIELHKKYGGVVPLVAKRAHEERIEPVITEALKRAKVKIEDLTL